MASLYGTTKELRRMLARIESLWVPELRERMHFRFEPYSRDNSPVSRLTLLLDNEPVWTFPNDYFDYGFNPGGNKVQRWGWHTTYSAHHTYGVFCDYIDRPLDQIFDNTEKDRWDIPALMRAADRRLGYKRLMWWMFMDMP
ncbi:MAG: hypothetical protein EOP83_08615, partial [Verrucomicrobiaceae bacterium]